MMVQHYFDTTSYTTSFDARQPQLSDALKASRVIVETVISLASLQSNVSRIVSRV